MAIVRNEIPLLEFDPDEVAVIQPDHEHLDMVLPERAVFAFAWGEVDRFALSHDARVVGSFISESRDWPIYVASFGGEDVCLCQAPVGAPAATQIMDWLIGYGARKIISTGCCGVLEDYEENAFLIPCRALRDEGTSFHYQAPSRFIDVPERARAALRAALDERGLAYDEVTTWSTDGFYRETRAKVEYRRSEGCAVVEMECSALAACAALRGITWGELLYSGDTLANVEAHDQRGWGMSSTQLALELGVEAVLKL